VPNLWDPSVANKGFSNEVGAAAWSPCSRFIALGIGQGSTVKILDAATLGELYTLSHTSGNRHYEGLIFSPDGHFLTVLFSGHLISLNLVIWDVQTGGQISDIQPSDLIRDIWERGYTPRIASYSRCGTMLGVLQRSPSSSCINTYKILSGTLISSYKFDHPIAGMIWTHSEYPQYTVLGTESITIWEVGPTPGHVSTVVDSLHIPYKLLSEDFLLSPSFSRIAFVYQQRVQVWDTQHHKILLNSVDVQDAMTMTFSSDGHFFASGTSGPEVYLWKESPNGYLLHQKLIPSTEPTVPVISPDRGSIVTFGGPMVHLWHIADSPTSPSDIPTQAPQATRGVYVLDFSPDKKLVAVTGKLKKGIDVLDLESSTLQWAVDMVARARSVRMLGSTLIAYCHDGSTITWDLPAGDHTLSTRGNIQKSVQTTVSKHLIPFESVTKISISPDLSKIATINDTRDQVDLKVYNMNTGKLLASDKRNASSSMCDLYWLPSLGYSPDGSEIWYAPDDDSRFQWGIVEDRKSGITRLEYFGSSRGPHGRFLWDSSHGYQVMDNGWILSSSRG